MLDRNKSYMNDNIISTINVAVATKLPVLLVGHTGTGKTTVVRELAKTKKKQLVRVSITGDTTVDDLVGKYELEAGATKWQDGVLTKAVKEGMWLVVDEINMAGGDITAAMHSLLDDDRFLTLIQHEQEVVKAHKDFRLFATMNPSHASNYAGTKPNNSAFLSRFGVVIEMDYLEPADEEALIMSKLPDAKQATVACFVSIANQLRKGYRDQQLNYICSTRDILSATQLATKGMQPGEAFDAAVAAKAADERSEVLKIAKHHIEEVLKLESQFPDRQVSFVTLREALAKIQQEKIAGISSKVDELYERRKKMLDESFEKLKAEEVKKLESRETAIATMEKRVTAEHDALVKKGYEQCKREFMDKLGLNTAEADF